jgi:dCTP deaminase
MNWRGSKPLGRFRTGAAEHRRQAETVLADHQIKAALDAGELLISPFDPEMIRPAAISLRLGSDAAALNASQTIDARDCNTYPSLAAKTQDDLGRIVVQPYEVLLASTLEKVAISHEMAGILDGISDVARLGISVVLSQQVSPGYGWPSGAVLTLEIVSRLPQPVMLYPGTRICNLMLMRCGRAARPYSDMLHNHSSDTKAMPSNWAAFHDQMRTGS